MKSTNTVNNLVRSRSRWAAVVSTAVLTLWAADAAAVGTRSFVLDSLDSFEGGDLAGVSIASDGSVRAGARARTYFGRRKRSMS